MNFIVISIQSCSIIWSLPGLSAFSSDDNCLSSCATQRKPVSWLAEWAKMIFSCSSNAHVHVHEYWGLAFRNFIGSLRVVQPLIPSVLGLEKCSLNMQVLGSIVPCAVNHYQSCICFNLDGYMGSMKAAFVVVTCFFYPGLFMNLKILSLMITVLFSLV